jgi:hypothetical protein
MCLIFCCFGGSILLFTFIVSIDVVMVVWLLLLVWGKNAAEPLFGGKQFTG